MLASELRPGDLAAQLALACAYVDREKLLDDALYPKLVGGHLVVRAFPPPKRTPTP